VQLLFAHRCSHSDCPLLRGTVATADRYLAPSDRFASLPPHGWSTVGSTVHHPAQECAPRCVGGSCTADASSVDVRPPDHFCRVEASRSAPIPRRADARAVGAAAARSEATASRRSSQPCYCTGQGSLSRANGGGKEMRAVLRRPPGQARGKHLHLQRVRRASLHRRVLRRVSCTAVSRASNHTIKTFATLLFLSTAIDKASVT